MPEDQRRRHRALPSRAARPRPPGQVQPHDQRVGAGRLVVAAPHADLLEAARRGTAAARVSLSTRTSRNTSVQPPPPASASSASSRAAPVPWPCRSRLTAMVTTSAWVAGGQQAGVADHRAVGLLRDQVVPAGGLLGQLALQHRPGPGLLAERLQLQRQDHVQVGGRHRAQHGAGAPSGGHGVTRLRWPGSRASGAAGTAARPGPRESRQRSAAPQWRPARAASGYRGPIGSAPSSG